jgi:hypothetical protein
VLEAPVLQVTLFKVELVPLFLGVKSEVLLEVSVDVKMQIGQVAAAVLAGT